MSCTCNSCGDKYKVDIEVPNEIWEKIKPEGKAEGAGLLCGVCIFKHLENLNKYSSFKLLIPIKVRHPKCNGFSDQTPDAGVEFECGYGSYLDCGECKYGLGRKDPEAKCNQTS